MSDYKKVLLVNGSSRLGVDISDEMDIELGKLRPLVQNRYGWGFPLYSGDMVLWDGSLDHENRSIYGIYGIKCEIGGIWMDIEISKDSITGSLSDYTGEFVPVYKLLEVGSLVDITINIQRVGRLNSIGI